MLIDKNELKGNTAYEVYKKVETNNISKKEFVCWYFKKTTLDNSKEKKWVLVNFFKNERTYFKTKKEILSVLKQMEEKDSVIFHTKKKIFE